MSQKPPNTPVVPDGSSYEAWEEARRVASLVANISSLFSTAIRFLRKDAESGSNTLSSTSKFCLQRLLNSASFKAPIYYAAQCFRPDSLPTDGYLSPTQLAAIFTPEELANLIGLLYLYRRIEKGCEEQEWVELSRQIHIHGEIGGHLGRAIPKIGLGWGVTLGAVRHLAQGLFLGLDKKRYVQFRRDLKIKKETFDLEGEMKIWGCTHVQVASMLVQALGLGGELSKSIATGLMVTGLNEGALDENSYRARCTWVWIEGLKATGQAPQMTHRGAYYPLKPDLERVYQAVALIRKSGPTHMVLAKGKEDISIEKTPCLFTDSQKAPPPPPVEEGQVEEEALQALGDINEEELEKDL